MSLSRIGKLPIEIPSGVTITVDSGDVTVEGPKRQTRAVCHTSRQRRGQRWRSHCLAQGRVKSSSRPARSDACANQQYGDRCYQRFRKEARGQRRRLPPRLLLQITNWK